MCSKDDILQRILFLESFGSFMTYKIDFESQNLAHFDDFYSSDLKT